MTLKINWRYSGLYGNQTDPRNKVGVVAWLLLNKGQLAFQLDNENWRTIKNKEIGGKILT
jgi:hypothetical protein